MKKLLTTKALLVSAALGLTACSPASKDSQVSYNSHNGSIINGTLIPKEDQIAKVTVAIIGVTKDKTGLENQFKCTGILYAANVVLTAAHCVPVAPAGGKRAAFIIFDTDINAASKETVRKVVDFAIHENWKKKMPESEGNSDFGMLKFEGEMPTGYEVGKFLAPDKHDILSAESDIIVAGYGRIDDGTETPNDQLRKGHVKIAGLLNEKEIAFNQKDRNGVCSGDSGGPAFIEVDGQMLAWGIASRVSGPDENTYCSEWSFHGLIGTQQEFIDSAMAQFSK